MAAKGQVAEEVFNQEVGLIRTRRRWIAEQQERLQAQLADLERYQVDPTMIEVLRKRLESRLAAATPEDRRFILDALETRVITQPNGSWEIELQVPCGSQNEETIVNKRSGKPLSARCGTASGLVILEEPFS